jgi:acyl dehydratase
MRFVDFSVGQVLHAGPYEVREQEILDFAKSWDPQWFHTDLEAASQGHFGGLIASGWHTCSIAMKLACESFLIGSESFASPGLSYLKWKLPVRPGDKLRLTATILDTRVSKSNPSLGVINWRWMIYNASDQEVLELEATNLFKIS